MTRLPFGLIAAALLSSGCVTLTNPVGDIDKAEPDKDLLGTWGTPGKSVLVIDRPEVKGNPKGLMRAIVKRAGERDEVYWFFTATAGKHTYANLLSSGGLFPLSDCPIRGSWGG